MTDVLLYSEVEVTKSYLALQKIRYVNCFQVIWDVSDAILNSKIQRLVLQPLVENSICHGLKWRPVGFPGLLKIHIYQRQGKIFIRVIDNGVGMSVEQKESLWKEKSYEKRSHIGLLNTRKRLVLRYGEEAKLRVYSKQNWGTSIHIALPMNVGEALEKTCGDGVDTEKI